MVIGIGAHTEAHAVGGELGRVLHLLAYLALCPMLGREPRPPALRLTPWLGASRSGQVLDINDVFMTFGVVWDGCQSSESKFFVKSRRLKTMRRQDNLMTASTNGLSFRGLHEGGP